MEKKKEMSKESKDQMRNVLKYIRDRCREEAAEDNVCEFDFGNDLRDWYNEALSSFFEKMADIVEDAVRDMESK